MKKYDKRSLLFISKYDKVHIIKNFVLSVNMIKCNMIKILKNLKYDKLQNDEDIYNFNANSYLKNAKK